MQYNLETYFNHMLSVSLISETEKNNIIDHVCFSVSEKKIVLESINIFIY